jgi:hypothetical protein
MASLGGDDCRGMHLISLLAAAACCHRARNTSQALHAACDKVQSKMSLRLVLVPWVSSRTAVTRLAAGGDDLEDDLALLLLPMSAGTERSAERAIARIA